MATIKKSAKSITTVHDALIRVQNNYVKISNVTFAKYPIIRVSTPVRYSREAIASLRCL